MKQVEGWIDIEELPVRADLKVVNIKDPNYGMTQDEIDDRNEFIKCYILSGFETLMTIPQQKFESDFFTEDWNDTVILEKGYADNAGIGVGDTISVLSTDGWK